VNGINKDNAPVYLRRDVRPEDPDHVERIVASTGFFNPEEIQVARSLVEERLRNGPGSGYHFLFAQRGDRPAGYACYGPILGTDRRFDLYWIAVDPSFQKMGIGRLLLEGTEEAVRALDGRKIYVETSSRALYEPTRRFYLKAGYGIEAVLRDFYAPEDHKIILSKTL